MFKAILTAAAFALTTLSAQAAIVPAETTAPIVEQTTPVEEVAYYCEWAYVYDYWGNWVTVWQCY